MGALRKRRVLVADESIAIQKLVHLGLAATQYEVIASSDGQDAYLKVKSMRPDLVLADCNLRQMDGFDLVEKIRNDSSLSFVRTVLLKGTIPKNKESRLKEVVTDEILAKPFDTKTLLELVHKWILDEESTPIASSIKPVGVPSKIEALNQKLEAIAAEVTDDSSLDEDTAKVAPAAFKQPVNGSGTVQRAEGQPAIPKAADTPTASQMESWVREEAVKWLEKNLPKLAEGIIKEEIQKLTKN